MIAHSGFMFLTYSTPTFPASLGFDASYETNNCDCNGHGKCIYDTVRGLALGAVVGGHSLPRDMSWRWLFLISPRLLPYPAQCRCEVGWEGATCTDPVCSHNCYEATTNSTCVMDQCVCGTGYDGADCSICLDHSPCFRCIVWVPVGGCYGGCYVVVSWRGLGVGAWEAAKVDSPRLSLNQPRACHRLFVDY